MTRHHEKPSKRINPSGKTVWVARYTNREGKRVSAGSFTLKRDAQDAINAAYEAHQSPGSLTIREYAEQWMRRHPRSTRTNETNEHRLQLLIGPFTDRQIERERQDRMRRRKPREGIKVEGIPLGDWPLAEFRRRHALEVLDVLLRDQGRAALGAKRVMDSLSAMYSDAMRDELVEANPLLGVRAKASDPRVVKASREARILPMVEMHRLAAAAGPDEAMVRLLSDCGLRLGELLGLAAEDVKLGEACDEHGCRAQGPHLHVRRTAYRGVVTVGTKQERLRDRIQGGRVVPLPESTAGLLRALPRRIAGPMFFTDSGKVWQEGNFRRDVWYPACRAAGLKVSPQDLRHSWVSECRAAGADPADLALFSGHSVQVADAVYTHALGRSWGVVAGVGA